MAKIRTVQLNNVATSYDEKVEKIVVYPETGQVDVTIFREFKSGGGTTVKTEDSTETFTGTEQDLDDISSKAVAIVNNARKSR